MASTTDGLIFLDWTAVVVPERQTKPRDPTLIATARWQGAEVVTIRRFKGGSNKQNGPCALNARMLDGDDVLDTVATNRVSSESRLTIQKARSAKKLTQVQLARLIQERPRVVQEYESGKATPSAHVLLKLERALAVKLRGEK